jgi:hypothetical protein
MDNKLLERIRLNNHNKRECEHLARQSHATILLALLMDN